MAPHIDWLEIYQDHSEDHPYLTGEVLVRADMNENKVTHTSQPNFVREGSYCTTVCIKITGGRIRMSGNPSRVGRQDNLFGYTSIHDCVAVYNKILSGYGLPPFTEGQQIITGEHTDKPKIDTTGAIITRIDLTSNIAVGANNVDDYLKALASLPYRNSVPRLHTNGKTTDWLSKAGHARLIYASVYNKAHDLLTKTLPKLKRKFGATSPEYHYCKSLIDYCNGQGVARFEQKFKSQFLRENNLNHYGHQDWDVLRKYHQEFLDIQNLLKVESMDFENIAEKLISEGIVDNTKAANTTAQYAFQWMHGRVFDTGNRNVQRHRCRLRKIGIDIATQCDLTKFSPVFIKEVRQISVKPVSIPDWYQKPQRTGFQLVA